MTVYGPAQVLERAAATCGLAPLLQDLAHVEAGTIVATEAVPGQVSAAAGASAVAAATAAIQACRAGQADAVIACPHNETAIHRAGIRFSGYPSLLATVCGVPEDEVFLMLVGGGLRIVHATLHESVRAALGRLSPALVVLQDVHDVDLDRRAAGRAVDERRVDLGLALRALHGYRLRTRIRRSSAAESG